jgi:inosine-uridine nucleoside N-ribohydrolase
LDVTQTAPLPLALIEKLAAQRPHPATAALLHATRHHAGDRTRREPGTPPSCPAPGLLGLAWLLQPGLFKTESGRVRVVPDGLAEGQSIMDRREHIPYPQGGWEAQIPQIQAALRVDAPASLALFESTLARNWLSSRPD